MTFFLKFKFFLGVLLLSFIVNSQARNLPIDPITYRQSELVFHSLFMIDWPSVEKDTINLCAITANSRSIAHVLAEKTGFRSKRHKIEISFIPDIRSALSFNRENTCHIFYLDPVLSNFNFSSIAELSYSQAILIIGHGSLFIEQGGMLSFIGDSPATTTLYGSTQFRHARLISIDKTLLNHVKPR